MEIAISFVIVIFMAVLAGKKGFNPWLWVLAGGIPGFIILLCMPSAATPEINEGRRKRRRKTGNIIGGMIGVTVIVFIIGYRLLLTNF